MALCPNGMQEGKLQTQNKKEFLETLTVELFSM
jgi:hypothetical protein